MRVTQLAKILIGISNLFVSGINIEDTCIILTLRVSHRRFWRVVAKHPHGFSRVYEFQSRNTRAAFKKMMKKVMKKGHSPIASQ